MAAQNVPNGQLDKFNNLFIEDKKRGAILLVDRSGSTGSKANIHGEAHLTIFDRMTQICAQLGHSEYRVVFWSSPTYRDGRFINGQMILPFVMRSDALQTAFALAADAPGGGTCPSLGFQAIKPEWLEKDPMVYLITDGQIGCSEMQDRDNRSQLAESIRKLPCQLTIIAVESVNRDFNRVENVANAAGGDIYKIIQEERLTGKVSRFVSYGPSGYFVQINKVRAPAGFAPYGDRYFSISRRAEFMEYVYNELQANNDEAKQLAIAQRLSATLEVLTRDRPAAMMADIIQTFSRMFTIDQNMVHYIMTGAIEQERGGQAQVFANYRAELKNLFAQAGALLKRDVCNAVGMNDAFITPVIDGRVLTGSRRLISSTVVIHGVAYPRAGFSATLPALPLLVADSRLTDIQDQCLRQWIRTIYAALYRVHQTSDEIIYLLLGDMLRVCTSPGVSERVRVGYRQLALCMLRKQRLNSQQTELARLMSGESPLANSGNHEDFPMYMQTVGNKLRLDGSAYKLWYDICVALDPVLAAVQKKYCFNVEGIENQRRENIQEDIVPESAMFEYSCCVTMEDISAVGGFRLNPHVSIVGNCSPVFLVSAEGRNQMIAHNMCICPVCYTALRAADFVPIGPKVLFDLPASYVSVAALFAESPVVGHAGNGRANNGRNKDRGGRNANANANPQVNANANGVGIRNANGAAGRLIIMKGVVGAGKSTTAEIIKNTVEARGGVCIVEGTDKYCKTGMSVRDAVVQVTQALNAISAVANNDLVVVIDTCGEQTHARSVFAFNINFDGWRREEVYPNLYRNNMAGYFAWSLRNVLRRGAVEANSNYYLSPNGAGISTCIKVHKKKAVALFGQKESRTCMFNGATVASLAQMADAYARNLQPFVFV